MRKQMLEKMLKNRETRRRRKATRPSESEVPDGEPAPHRKIRTVRYSTQCRRLGNTLRAGHVLEWNTGGPVECSFHFYLPEFAVQGRNSV